MTKLGVALFLVLLGCGLGGGLVRSDRVVETAPPAPPADPLDTLWPGTAPWAEAVLDTLALEEKVGQLFVTHARGTAEGTRGAEWARLTALAREGMIGGVLFFKGEAATQARATRDLQARTAIPLLVAQDMEFGPGMRVEGGTAFPNPMALGATRSPELAYLMGRAVAEEARAMGVHQNYAPVADVNNNPLNPIINVRSFGEDPALVAALATAYMRGMQDGGLIATVKHFPGHGDTETDSHAALPVLPFDRDRLDAVELVPFRAAVDAGVMSVMTGHLDLPQLDPGLPATLSRRIITGLLREDLGFPGLVVTDGLDMAGVRAGRDAGEVAVAALEAGVDQLILTRDERRAHAAVLAAVRSGRLAESRIDASVRRILRAKAWAGLATPLRVSPATPADERRGGPTPTPSPEAPRPDRFRALAAPDDDVLRRSERLADEIARRAITVVQAPDGPLPFVGPDAPRRVLTLVLDDSNDERTGLPFVGAVAASVPDGGAATHRRLGEDDPPQRFAEALAQAPLHDVVLVATFVRVRSWSGQIELPARHKAFVERLMAGPRPVVLLAFGNPYVPLGLPRPAAYVAGYGGTDAIQRAAADALFGRIPVQGRLPVSVPGRYRYGQGVALAQQALRPAPPEEAGLDADVVEAIERVIEDGIANRAFPGAAVAVGRSGRLVHLAGYGHFTYARADAVTPRSVYDLASVTKVVATTAAAMHLVEEGRLDLDAPVARYLPAFGQAGKAAVTVRHLLAHQAGQRAFHPFHTHADLQTPEAIRAFIHADPLRYPPGTRTVYSDFDMIVLGDVIEAVTGQPLDVVAREAFFEPLGMTRTTFRETGRTDPTVVPTEVDRTFRRRTLQGEVHDEAAWLLGGVAGHAGLFSTAEDLARFAFLLTNGGEAYGQRLLRPETIEAFTRRVSPRGQYPMALGWMTWRPPEEGSSSAGTLFGPRSYGHTGYTGTSIWIDPDRELFVVLLTNRVHPSRSPNRIQPVRVALADAVAGAVREADPLRTLGFGVPPGDLLRP
ncbi:MAG: glycoside hydrolase family 3 N-terminal domain-containing protein [Rubricoccaceae bacterium]|nr:glycoside hydrolase family 3 N-terminal domain-containing protein [Rubricoccaceae bacterium]